MSRSPASNIRVMLPVLLVLLASLASANVVKVGSTVDCTASSLTHLTCNGNDHSKCCGLSDTCCGGGCCPLGSVCLGIGSGNETCCSGLDWTTCGFPALYVPVVNNVCPGAVGNGPYNCPPNVGCDQNTHGCVSGAGSGSSTGAAAASSSAAAKSDASSGKIAMLQIPGLVTWIALTGAFIANGCL